MIVHDVNPHDDVLEEVLQRQAGDSTDHADAGNHGRDVDVVGLKHRKQTDDDDDSLDGIENAPHKSIQANVRGVDFFPIFLG